MLKIKMAILFNFDILPIFVYYTGDVFVIGDLCETFIRISNNSDI